MIRDRLNLTERTEALFNLHKKWNTDGSIQEVGYETYGMQSDIQHIELEMKRNHYHFSITPIGGNMAKNDRIRRLVPDFESNYSKEELLKKAEQLTFV